MPTMMTMRTQADQPWMVLARRPAPLATTFRSESERMRGDQSRIDHQGIDEGERPLADVGTPPVPPPVPGKHV
jgi:hypothetical protein